MSYTKTVWRNNQAPAINADNLNHIEQGIESAHNQMAINTSDIETLTTQIQNNATNIASEISARQSGDSNLQSQIDQIIAPSGEAPSAAEVENARIGDDGVTYDTLGNAIRGQFADVKNVLNKVGHPDGIMDEVVITDGGQLYYSSDFHDVFYVDAKKIHIADAVSGLTDSGNIHGFFPLAVYMPLNLVTKHQPYTVYIKFVDGQESEVSIDLGFCSRKSFNTSYSAFNDKVFTVSKTGFYCKTTGFTTNLSHTEFRYAYFKGTLADLAKIEYVTFIPSLFGNEMKKADEALEAIAEANDNIAELQLSTPFYCDTICSPVIEFPQGAATQIDHTIDDTKMLSVSDVISSSGEYVNLFAKLKNPVSLPDNDYYPFTVYVKMKKAYLNDTVQLWIGYATASSFNSTYATLNYIHRTFKGSSFIYQTEPYTRTAGTKFNYVYIYGYLTDLNKIESVSIMPSLWANDILPEQEEPTLNDYSYIAYGDSLTQGAGGEGVTYCSALHTYFPLSTYFVEGAGGDNPSAIAYRAHAGELIIPANTDPTTAFTPEMSFGSKPFNIPPYSTSKTFTVHVEGVEYTATNGENGKITIANCPTAVYPRGICFDHKRTANVAILWLGTNSSRVFEDVKPYIDSIISELSTNNYIVIGLTIDGTNGNVETYNTAAKAYYREHFLDLKPLIVNYGLAMMNITPTAEDTARIAANCVPTSLLASGDTVHFNANGYRLIGKLLAEKIWSLGYDRFLT